MRVLHVASGDGWGGAEVATLELVRGLEARPDVEVRALVLNEGELAQRLGEAGVAVELVEEDGLSFLELRRRVRPILANGHWDVVHAHRYKEIMLVSSLGLPGRTKRVVTVHGAEPLRRLDNRSRVQIWGALWLARLVGARFAAVSPELAERLSRVFGGSCVVRVDNPMPGLETAEAEDLRSRFGWPSDCGLVAFVGRLEAVKGPDLCLDVLKRCPRDLRLVMMGAGSMEAELRRAVRSAPDLEGRVEFVGAVSRPTRYFAQLDALALTSRHEGQPIALLEAARAALPVAAFAVGGVPELLRDAPPSWLVEAGNVDAMAEALRDLAADRPQAGDDARRWSDALRSHHGRDAVVDRYVAAMYRGGPPAGATAAAAGPAVPGRSGRAAEEADSHRPDSRSDCS